MAEWKKKVAAYPAAQDKAIKNYVATLKAHIKAVEAGEQGPWKYSYNFPAVKYPDTPLSQEDFITAKFDKQLDKLLLSSDENLVVDDRSDFFQFI